MVLECKLLISKQGNGGRAGTRTPDLLRVNYQVALLTDPRVCAKVLVIQGYCGYGNSFLATLKGLSQPWVIPTLPYILPYVGSGTNGCVSAPSDRAFIELASRCTGHSVSCNLAHLKSDDSRPSGDYKTDITRF